MTHALRFRPFVKIQKLSQKFTSDIDIHKRNQQCITIGPKEVKNVKLQAACNLPHTKLQVIIIIIRLIVTE